MPKKGTVGLLVMRSLVLAGDTEHYDGVIEALEARGFSHDEVALVRRRLDGTHWKRRPPAVALVSHSGIGESYLRPVDY